MDYNIINTVIFSFITAVGITFLSIPAIIKVAKEKQLYDEPNKRKSHTTKIPTLGGIGIFAGVMFAITFWTDFSQCLHLQFIIAAMTVISFIGIKDDISGLSASKKLLGQLFAAIILVIWGDIRVTSMLGVFGIGEVHFIFSVIFSTFTILVIINAFNMIDGINGLSASFGIISAVTFGIWFFLIENYQHAIIAVALVGSLLAFLRFNISPAKIFMGDTGSMLLGLILSVLAIEFIQTNIDFKTMPYAVQAAPMVAIGTLFIPLFDLLRVFSIRIYRGRSPFRPDRNHLHHILIDTGLSHNFATFILSIFAIILTITVFLLQGIGNYWLGSLLFVSTLSFSIIIYLLAKNKSKKI